MTLKTLAPRLGAASVVAFVVLGQMLSSAVIDHFGLLGLPVHPDGWQRAGGLVLLGLGVALVKVP